MSAFTRRTVDSAGVRLATRDYGGNGLPLVLMHGAGMDQGSLEPLAEQLRSAFRVITFDFRGHGSTGPAPWTLGSAVHDIGAVAEAYGLGVPAVAGHSLGGMVAAAYGVQHPTCAGVVNIDGHGLGRAEQYIGYDESDVRQWWAHMQRRVDRLTTGAPGAILRALLVLSRKPAVSPETVRQVRQEVDVIDLFALYQQLGCPLMVFNATAAEESRLRQRWAGQGLSLVAAYRKGLGRDLAGLAARHDLVKVVTVDATHMLVRTHPGLVAGHITTFLTGRPTRDDSAPALR